MESKLTPEREAEIRARLEAATPGEWHVRKYPALGAIGVYRRHALLANTQSVELDGEANAEFIAHSREDIPLLLAALDAERARVAEFERGRHETIA